MQALGGLPANDLSYSVEELSIFTRNEHNDLIVSVMELIAARNIAVAMTKKYNEIRETIEEDLAEMATFGGEGVHIQAVAEFNKTEHPALVGKIHKANGILLQLEALLNNAYAHGKATAASLSSELPRYFPKGTKLKKVDFP
jgi:hypothetical protein